MKSGKYVQRTLEQGLKPIYPRGRAVYVSGWGTAPSQTLIFDMDDLMYYNIRALIRYDTVDQRALKS